MSSRGVHALSNLMHIFIVLEKEVIILKALCNEFFDGAIFAHY
jgi:hypothetical protein